MTKITFYLLCAGIVALSLISAITFKCYDWFGLFISCLGSIATLVTLYVAYKIFANYSSPADIQKRRFELVDKALGFLITKRFLGMIEYDSTSDATYNLYLTKQRLDSFQKSLKAGKLDEKRVIISKDFFDFLAEFQSQSENHFFPYDLKIIILSNLPQSMSIVSGEETNDKIKIAISYGSDTYGVPFYER